MPSLTVDQTELGKLAGAAYFEERLLVLLIDPRSVTAESSSGYRVLTWTLEASALGHR